ncbi:YbfB/YjiJ family MFS transporter [Nocardia callitridis]|uniref:YbfB/YjiJ family MFS transporter n=1 Tax=Nocardia callitridis TaxID=648753 RepID=A0ABP9KBP5_9NOCA
MTRTIPTIARRPTSRSELGTALAAASGLAAAMGIGRFVYTPLLPVMVDAHRFDADAGALIATANYVGYLLGALLLTWRPDLNNRTVFRVSAGALIVSEAVMMLPGPAILPAAARLVAGVASAVIFVGCAAVAARPGSHKFGSGIAFGGVGFGIAVTGLLVLGLRPVLSWQSLWLVSGLCTLILVIPALSLDIRPGTRGGTSTKRTGYAWRALLVAYFLEGVGYIVIGTFLVAAVSEQHGPVLGASMWVIVGAVAAPATVLWGILTRRWRPAVALPIALLAQCVSAILPVVSGHIVPTALSAALFGATFLGIVMLTMRIGTELTDSGAAAPLTAVYGAGQIVGPLVVAPVISDSYPVAFVIATIVLAVATVAALATARKIRRT